MTQPQPSPTGPELVEQALGAAVPAWRVLGRMGRAALDTWKQAEQYRAGQVEALAAGWEAEAGSEDGCCAATLQRCAAELRAKVAP